MCTPETIIAAGQTITNIAGNTVGIIQDRKNAKYNAQVAATNAKIAVSKAKQEEQTGIEEARKEKIKGIQEASSVYAQNAANGFDANSATNLYNYQDTYTTSENAAQSVLDKYKSNAQDYYTQANQYLNDANNTIANYNMSLLNTGLGMTTKVGSYWISN